MRIGVNPDAAEDCDGIADTDCNPKTVVAAVEADADGDTYRACGGDCDDTRDDVNPGAIEICDPLDTDEDCNGLADDEEKALKGAYDVYGYVDGDGDGYGAGALLGSCEGGWLLPDDTDCDDVEPAVNPGATEDCLSTADDDCDGFTHDCPKYGDVTSALDRTLYGFDGDELHTLRLTWRLQQSYGSGGALELVCNMRPPWQVLWTSREVSSCAPRPTRRVQILLARKPKTYEAI